MNKKIKKSKWGKLPKKFKERWIKALRSGKYTQGYGVLCDGNKYCCLGVIEKICNVYSESNCYLIMKSSKVPSILKGTSKENKLVEKLICMNDYSQKSFKEIAKWIEKNL